MSDGRRPNVQPQERSGPGTAGWRVVLTRELADLWTGGKAMILLTIFSVLLGITSYLLATNNELNLTPIKEIAFLMLKLTIAFGLFISLIIGADSISGERERGTLEGLLLTPASRRHIVLGKFLAALSPWPAAFAISVPLIVMLCRDRHVVSESLLWGFILGSITVTAFTGLGMLVSFWSGSNRTSIFVSLVLFLVFLLPSQFPGPAQTGAFADFLQKWNPIEATNQFLQKIIVNNRTVDEMAFYLESPVLFAVLTVGLLFFYASPALRLQPGRARRNRPSLRRATGTVIVAGVVIAGGLALCRPVSAATETAPPLQIALDTKWARAKVSDEVAFTTVVTNHGAEQSPPMIVAMNIIDLKGEVVDPEDWSPKRTQYTEPLGPGESVEQTWTIDAILKGNYMVYMVVIPVPDRAEVTSQPVASSGLHLTVTPYTPINPGGVVPLAVGIPLGLTLSTGLLRWRRRRAINL